MRLGVRLLLALGALASPLLLSLPTAAGRKPEIRPEEIVRKCGPAVVLIEATNADGNIHQGTGFLITSFGKIATNEHIIHGAERISVRLTDGSRHDVQHVIRTDLANDLALLKISGTGYPMVSVWGSAAQEIGGRVYVIGNPKGLENTITDGLFSGRRYLDGEKLYQISAPISPGSSGSPVFDSTGEVIGVARSSLIGGENLNLAVPVYFLRTLMAEGSYITSRMASGDPIRMVRAFSLTMKYSGTVRYFRPSLSSEGATDIADVLLYYADSKQNALDARLLLAVLAEWSFLDHVEWRDGRMLMFGEPLEKAVGAVARQLRSSLDSSSSPPTRDQIQTSLKRLCESQGVTGEQASKLAADALRSYLRLCGTPESCNTTKPSRRWTQHSHHRQGRSGSR